MNDQRIPLCSKKTRSDYKVISTTESVFNINVMTMYDAINGDMTRYRIHSADYGRQVTEREERPLMAKVVFGDFSGVELLQFHNVERFTM